MGMSHRQAVLTIYGICFLSGALAIFVQFVSPEIAYLIFGAALLTGLTLIIFLERTSR